MGVEKDRISIRLSEEELEKLDRLQFTFRRIAKSRSAMIAMLIDAFEEKLPRFESLAAFNMAMTLLGAVALLQRMLSPTLCVERNTFEVVPDESQVQIQFPAQQQECRPVELRHTPIQLHRFQLLSPRSRADRPLVLGMAANRPPSSLAKISAYFEERLA